MVPRAIFPVPFRWFYYLAKTVYTHKKNKDQDLIKQDEKKYFCLLRELILNKQAADFEKTDEDKIADLRQDILNELRKLKEVK